MSNCGLPQLSLTQRVASFVRPTTLIQHQPRKILDHFLSEELYPVCVATLIFFGNLEMVSPMAKGHNTTLNQHYPMNTVAHFRSVEVLPVCVGSRIRFRFAKISKVPNPTAKNHNATLNQHRPLNIADRKWSQVLFPFSVGTIICQILSQNHSKISTSFFHSMKQQQTPIPLTVLVASTLHA